MKSTDDNYQALQIRIGLEVLIIPGHLYTSHQQQLSFASDATQLTRTKANQINKVNNIKEMQSPPNILPREDNL